MLPLTTHVNALVGAARCETLVRLPVDVECGRGVEGELLLVLPRLRVPYDGRAVDPRALQGDIIDSYRLVQNLIFRAILCNLTMLLSMVPCDCEV